MKGFLNLAAIFIVLIVLASFDFSKETFKYSFSEIQNDPDSLKIKISIASFQKDLKRQFPYEDSFLIISHSLRVTNYNRSKPHCAIGIKE